MYRAEIVAAKWGWKSVEAGGIPGSQKEFWAPDSKLTKDPGWAVFARLMNTVSPANLPANGRTEEQREYVDHRERCEAHLTLKEGRMLHTC